MNGLLSLLKLNTAEPRSKASAYKAMPAYKAFTKSPKFFLVRDRIHSVADYNSTLMGVVVVVVVRIFHDGITRERLELSS